MRDYIRGRQLDATEYIDIGYSGAKNDRPGLNRMMADARQRKFDQVIVWKFDRFGRSLRDLVNSLEEFRSLGIQFVSVTEAIDTSSPLGAVLFAIIGAMAQFERDLIIERVHAGLDRARKQGKALGRQAKVIDREKVLESYVATQSLRETARQFGVSKDKIRATLQSISLGECFSTKELGATQCRALATRQP